MALIHHNAFVDFLPQMRSEDLNERDLKCRDLAMHEYSSQIELYLETDIHISSVDCGRPPKSKPTIWDLVES